MTRVDIIESLIAIGTAMAAPAAPNTNESGCAKNRRAEIVAA